jgi:tetratricopeptide (TPR) repeat protein
MAVSKEAQQFNLPAAICFSKVLELLPTLSLRVAPFTVSVATVESQTYPEIRARAQVYNNYYRLKINCDEIQPLICNVRIEAATSGLTDLGLGLMTVRQLLTVLRLNLDGRLAKDNLPAFFRPLVLPAPKSIQMHYERLVDTAFENAKRGLADNALAEFSSAQNMNPTDDAVYFHRGMLHLVLGKLEDAERDFELAMRYAPEHLLARLYYQDITTKLAQKRATAISMTMISERPHGNTDTNPSQEIILPNKKTKTDENASTIKTPKPPEPNHHYLRSNLLDQGVYEISKPLTTVGRQETCDVVIRDKLISRLQAEIHFHKTFCTVKDANSTNGTFVNENKLNPGDIYTLANQDKISFGGLEVVYTCAYEPETLNSAEETITKPVPKSRN